MDKSLVPAVVFLVLCAVMAVLAIALKYDAVQQEAAFMSQLTRDVWTTKAHADELQLWRESTVDELRTTRVRLSVLENRVENPLPLTVSGDAYCVVLTDGETVNLECRPFD